MSKVRSLFPNEVIISSYRDAGKSIPKTTRFLNNWAGHQGIELVRPLSPQLVRYWVASIDTTDEVDTEAQQSPADNLALAGATVRELNARTGANQTRKINRALVDYINSLTGITEALQEAMDNITARPPAVMVVPASLPHATPVTLEVLFSDLQMGKLSKHYNSQIATARIYEMCSEIMMAVQRAHSTGLRVERIILALIGDIIESDKKHKNSARGTDMGTAQQIAHCVQHLFIGMIEPLASLRVPMSVVCVTGNHDHDDHGINMVAPGIEHLSYPLYTSLEMITQASKYTWVEFSIPRGSFFVENIYGNKVLYEHGVGVSVSEASMKGHKIKRSEQLREYITLFRMGDKHTLCSFNAGQYVVNGSFFGADGAGDEYSSISGYASVPAQYIAFHSAAGIVSEHAIKFKKETH